MSFAGSARKARACTAIASCYADILFPENDIHPAIDIELQGHMVHDGGRAGGIDSNRMLGLKRMGIEVIMVTAEQLYNPGRFIVCRPTCRRCSENGGRRNRRAWKPPSAT